MFAAALIVVAVSGSPVYAGDVVKSFDIPAEPAAAALNEFARQADITLAFSYDLVAGERTQAVKGNLSIPDALAKLLKGTKLDFKSVSDKTIAIELAATKKSADGSMHFNIPVQGLDGALKDFSAQAGLAVVAANEITDGKKSQGVRGTMKASDALRRLLKGSGLAFVLGTDGNYAIQANAAEGPNQEKADTADLTVEGQQQKEKPYAGGNVDIPRTIDDVQPYYVFDSQTLELSGATNVEDFLKKQLTMNAVAQSNSQLTGGIANNISQINLRGLGTQETLVLVDGRRMAGAVSSQGSLNSYSTEQPDVNGIPIAAIDRIEVLPSSASGIYGGSAIGGVINIILKKNYTGGDVRVSYDRDSASSAHTTDFFASYGTGFADGKVHAMVTASYSDSTPLVAGDREALILRGYNSFLARDPGFVGFGPLTQFQNPLLGSTTNIIGFTQNPSTGQLVPAALTLASTGQSLGCATASLPAGYSASSNPSTIKCGWNLNPPNTYQSPDGLLSPLGANTKVESVTLRLDRQVSESLQLFFDASASKNEAFERVSRIDETWLVPAGAPTNPFNQNVYISFPDAFSQQNTGSSDSYAATLGVNATLPGGWRGEGDFTWSRSTFEGPAAVVDTNACCNGKVESAVSSGAINPFVDTLAHPISFAPYVGEFYNPYQPSTLLDTALRATGPVAHWSWGEPTLSLGLEQRRESLGEGIGYLLQSIPSDPKYDPPGTTQEFLPATQSTTSVYAEGVVPIVTDKNAVPWIHNFELQITDRIERYVASTGADSIFNNPGPPPTYYISPAPPNANPDGSGGTEVQSKATYQSNNQTFGFKYEPVKDVTFRASIGTAFLPPTHDQLQRNPIVNANGDTILDPKTGTQYSVSTLNGGNPDIQPQRSKNWDEGVVWQPSGGLLDGLRVDVEHYEIAQYHAIISPSGNLILSIPALAASRVTRNPTTGLITLINERAINTLKYETSGWDASVNYDLHTAIGMWRVRTAVTYVNHNWQTIYPGTPAIDYAAAPADDASGTLKIRANAGVTWAYQRWVVNWNTTLTTAHTLRQGRLETRMTSMTHIF